MKLYTKGGDEGETGLLKGVRVPKDHPRVTAYGHVDETNAAIGAVIATCKDTETSDTLRRIQSDLFVLGAGLATPNGMEPDIEIGPDRAAQLERWIDEASDETPPLESLVLPGGTATGAGLHQARAVCRRAERAVVALKRQESVGKWTLIYLNRLSDLLFALARRANHRAGMADIPWGGRTD